MSSSPREENRVPGLVAKSDADNTPVIIEADPVTKRLKVNATISGGGASDGAIVDGGGSGLKATVLESSSVPGKYGVVVLNPDASNIGGGSGGSGTEYTEDAATPANPIAPALSLRRRDTLATETTTDGDWTTANSTAKGEMYVKHTDAIPITDNSGSITVDQPTASNLNVQAVGNVAAGATDSGNPVKVGGKYNSTLPTYTDGQRSDLQVDTRGGLQIVVTDKDGTGGAVVGSQATNVVTNVNGLQTRSTTYGQFNDVSPGALTEARLGIQRMSANRNAYTTIRDAAGNERGANVDANGNLNVINSATDVAPATQNVTVVDSGSTPTVSNNGQILITGSPTASSAASFALSSLETVRVQVSGTWTGTLTSEISIDGGTTWFAQGLHQGAYTTSTFFGNFVGGGSVTGATNFRMRATAAVTGTAVVKIVESINTNSVYIANAAPAGTIISLLNSSTATLTSGSVFTGAGEDVSNFSEMRVSVFANVASATDGLSLQQSSDNTNWDIVDTYTIAAAGGKTFVVPRQARYFRVVYTNGGTNQATFRLSSILNRTATAPSSNRASDGYTNETDLVQNQTFPMVYNGTTWDRLRGDATNGEFVQLKTAIPAGANVIGHVIADSGSTTAVTQATGTNLHTVLDSGTLTTLTTLTGTTTLTPGTGATNLGKAEDAAHASGDTGVFALAVRNDNLATTYGADQDYSPIATDLNGRVMVAQKAATSTASNVAASATSVTVLSANASRIGGSISNDSSAVLYLKFGATASTTSYKVTMAASASAPFSYYEIPAGYTGRIDGLSASATGNYRVAEET